MIIFLWTYLLDLSIKKDQMLSSDYDTKLRFIYNELDI